MKPVPKHMIVTGQSIKFTQQAQTDPEGQTAIREYRAMAPAGPQSGNAGAGGLAGQVGQIPAVIQYATGAGQMANAVRTSCAACKHHDVKAWRNFVANSTGPGSTVEDRETIRTFANRIAIAGYGYHNEKNDEHDVERTLMAHGVCHVLSDIVEQHFGRMPERWPVVPWREANCPEKMELGQGKPPLEIVTAQRPYGFFEPKDKDQQKIGAQRYDAVLRAAQGKK